MGNSSSSAQVGGRRRRGNLLPPAAPAPAAPPPPQVGGNHYVFAAATPYPGQYPNPNAPQYYPYGGYYPSALPAPFDHRGGVGGAVDPAAHPNWGGAARYACPPPHPAPAAYVEHQKAVTIKNDVNLKKESLRIEPDENNPGQYLVAFTFDATVAGRITVLFFAKEGAGCKLLSAKEKFEPVTLTFEKGLGQKFRQPTGTGINFSLFEESELTKMGDIEEVYPLAVKAETSAEAQIDGNKVSTNSLITQAVFEKKDQGEYHVKVSKQILWVEDMRYELQEIYGIGNSVENDFDGNDPGKECVICLSEARDTTVLPCRHMCLCSGCADVLRFQTSRCPICRQPVERFLEIKLSNTPETKRCEGSKDDNKEVLDSGAMKPAKQVSE